MRCSLSQSFTAHLTCGGEGNNITHRRSGSAYDPQLEAQVSEGTPGERAVFLLCESTTAALVFVAVTRLIAGKSLGASLGLFVLAIFFAVAGVMWPTAKTKLGAKFSRVSSGIERLAAGYRFRTVCIIAVTLTAAVALSLYLHSLRETLNTYVMPRVVTQEQAARLRKFLSAHPSNVKVNVDVSAADPEALEYAAELINAIKAGGWDAQFWTVNPWAPDRPSPKRKPVSNMFLELDRGLLIRVCIPGQPTNPNPRHPSPDVILNEAFRKAHIQVNGGGMSTDCGAYSVVVEVGRRPEKVGVRPPALFRLGRWLMGLEH